MRGFLRDQVGSETGFRGEIHPADSMYRFALHEDLGQPDLALVNYLRSGLSAFRVLDQVLRWRFGERGEPRVLDFASGYGRTTRFFVLERPARTLTVSDIDPEAVRFQRERFGVGGFVSAPSPAQLATDGSYDAVFAASFFSHMPREAFERWLATLWDLVAEGGVLAFSVNGAAVLPPGWEMPAEGIRFERVSESESLDVEEYGSSWVTEDFVRAALERAAGATIRAYRVPRGLWHRQDLYVALHPSASCDLPELALRLDPEGRLEGCEITPGPSLALRGWAVGPRAPDGTLEEVEVEARLDGKVVGTARPDGLRVDVLRHLGCRAIEKGTGGLGWDLRAVVAPEALDPAAELLVKATAAGGGEEVLHLGTLGAAMPFLLLAETVADLERERARAVRAEAEREDLRGRIKAMEASRFWKLRNRWFALKRSLGLTDEA